MKLAIYYIQYDNGLIGSPKQAEGKEKDKLLGRKSNRS